jgi:hypothetical protein
MIKLYILCLQQSLIKVTTKKLKNQVRSGTRMMHLQKLQMLHHMKDNIIPLFEERPTAKDMMDALETKYGCRSDTQIQLLLDKFNNIKMNKGDIVGDHVNQLELIAKELADVGHTLSDKMQVTVVLNNLPPS